MKSIEAQSIRGLRLVSLEKIRCHIFYTFLPGIPGQMQI